MRIYLANVPFIKNFVRCGRWQGAAARGKSFYYPIWLAYAAGYLEKEGYDVRFVDAIANEWDLEKLLADASNFNPDLLVVESNFSSLKNDIKVANLIKEKTDVVNIIVGPPASQFPEEIIEKGIDIVARYEFEESLAEIASAIEKDENFHNIKGITFRDEYGINNNPDRKLSTSKFLDELPFVSQVYKRHLKLENYFLSHALYPVIQISTGRGCPNFCTFCSWTETLMGRKYRFRSVKNVADEFEFIRDELPEIQEIFIDDDSFTLNKKRLFEFCDELIKRDINMTWSCLSRADLNYVTMKKMKAAGCRLLDVGYESGNDKILKNIKKGVNVDQLRDFTADAKKAGLKILADFVIGFPGETALTAEQTIDFIKEIKPDLLQVAFAIPIPGTEFYDWVMQKGYIKTEDMGESIDENGFQRCIVSYPNFDSEQIQEYVMKSLKGYYLSLDYLSIAISNIFRKNGYQELLSMIRSGEVFFRYINQ